MSVFVMRGIGLCRYDSRRPFPVGATPSFIADRRSWRNPFRIPPSTSKVRCPGVPSSSIPNEPRFPGTVASSAMETSGLPIRSPTFSL
jgi:hypothetical protein